MPSLISHFFRFTMRRASIFGKPGEPVAERRAKIEKLVRLAPTPAGLAVTPVEINLAGAAPVPAEWEAPTGAPDDQVLLYIHGGAWIICSPRSHRGMVAQIARAAGIKALSIDYRLAPEHPFPAGLEDCLTAYRWLLAQGIAPQKIVIAGDSAGGNLTLATLLALREAGDPLPAAAVCLSPATDMTASGESRRTRDQVDPVLGRGKSGGVIALYAPGQDLRSPLLSPLFGDLRGLPPILVHVGDHEILRDDATVFVERACAAGVDARVVVWPEMWHVFQMHAPWMPEAVESIKQIGAFMKEKVA